MGDCLTVPMIPAPKGRKNHTAVMAGNILDPLQTQFKGDLLDTSVHW
jgi:hypothetical protein